MLESPATAGRRAEWRVDWPARVLAAVCVLNLNGVFSMMFDIGQAISLVMLCMTAVLIAATGRRAWSAPFGLLMAAIAGYLVLGALLYSPLSSVEPASKYLQSYFNAMLIIWALTGYVAGLPPGPRLVGFLRFLRTVLLVSAASVWASPVLYEHYVNLPFSFEQRMGGFFGNPNEAAMVSVLAVALTLGLPFRSRLAQTAALAMAGIAVFMTFSKTGMSCLVVVVVWHLVRGARGIRLAALLFGGLAAIALIQDADGVMLLVADNPVLDLDEYQKGRILAIGQILGGRIDEATSTGRTYLWALAMEHALEAFPLGTGLGSGHHLTGGLFQLDAWQGAHNTLLMIWLESGIFPATLLALSLLFSVSASMFHARGNIEILCMLILIIDMMATHTALVTRYHNVMIAVVFGLLAISKKTDENMELKIAYREA